MEGKYGSEVTRKADICSIFDHFLFALFFDLKKNIKFDETCLEYVQGEGKCA